MITFLMAADFLLDLPQHAQGMRSLARLLVGDQDADDLLQDVALQLLQSDMPPPSAWLPNWLQVVMRRRASNRRRDAHRRQQREHAAVMARGDEGVDPARTAAHRETLARVTKALLELQEPFRDTLFQRFFQDRTPTEIAVAAGIPLPTVKSRLQRGLDMLRERVETSIGSDWRAALTAAFGLDRALVRGTVAGGGLWAVAWKLAAAASVVAVAGWFAIDAVRAPAPHAVDVAVGPIAPVVGAPTGDASSPADGRTAVPTGPVVRALPTQVRGRCVDAQGRPLPGVEVSLHTDGFDGGVDDRPRWAPPPQPIDLRGRTGADGSFAIEFAAVGPQVVKLEFAGSGLVVANGSCRVRQPGDDVEVPPVVMLRGMRCIGRVVDRTGRPQPGVTVDFYRQIPDEELDGWLHLASGALADTRADGTFELAQVLPVGDYEVSIDERRGLAPQRVVLDGSNSVPVFEFTVDPADVPMCMRGVVVDSAGVPVVRAALTCDRGHWTYTDASGAFRLARPIGVPDRVALRVDAEHFEEWRSGSDAFAWGSDDVQIVLERGVAIEVEAVAADSGAPVADYRVRLEGLDSEGRHLRTELVGDGVHAGGRVVLPPVRRGQYLLRVEPRDLALGVSTFARIDVAVGAPARVRAVLHASAERRVRVQFGDGTPAIGAAIELLDPLGEDTVAADEVSGRRGTAFGMRIPQRCAVLERAVTDADGISVVHGPAGVRLALALRSGGGVVAAVHGNVVLGLPEPIVVVAQRAGAIAGKVTPPEALAMLRQTAGLSAEGPWADGAPRIELHRVVDGAVVEVSRRDGGRIEQGEYSVDGLVDGDWQIGIEWRATTDGRTFMVGWERIGDVTIRNGETTTMDLDLRAVAPGELRGRVLCDGAPLADTDLTLACERGIGRDGRPIESYLDVRTDGDGRFVHFGPQGTCHIEWFGQDSMFVTPERVFVPTGKRVDATFTLQTGRLRLRLLTADGAPVRGIEPDFVDPAAGFVYVHRVATDEQGWLDVRLQAGTYEVRVLPRPLMARAQQEAYASEHGTAAMAALAIRIATVSLASGEVVERELRLPREWDRELR